VHVAFVLNYYLRTNKENKEKEQQHNPHKKMTNLGAILTANAPLEMTAGFSTLCPCCVLVLRVKGRMFV